MGCGDELSRQRKGLWVAFCVAGHQKKRIHICLLITRDRADAAFPSSLAGFGVG